MLLKRKLFLGLVMALSLFVTSEDAEARHRRCRVVRRLHHHHHLAGYNSGYVGSSHGGYRSAGQSGLYGYSGAYGDYRTSYAAPAGSQNFGNSSGVNFGGYGSAGYGSAGSTDLCCY